MAQAAVGRGNADHRLHPPHDRRFPTDPRRVHARRGALRDGLDGGRRAARVVPGAEIASRHLPELDDAELAWPAWAGAGAGCCWRCRSRGGRSGCPQVLADLEIRGYGVILAHPERAEAVQRAPDRMRDIVGRGALVQLTAQSLTRRARPARAPRRRGCCWPAGWPTSSPRTPTRPGRGGRRGWRTGSSAAADAVASEPEALQLDGRGRVPRRCVEGRPVRPPRLTPCEGPGGSSVRAPGAPRSPTRG